MAKLKTAYVCNDCGGEHTQWQGQCSSCGAWNTLSRISLGSAKQAVAGVGYSGGAAEVGVLADIEAADTARLPTGFSGFDRVLGGELTVWFCCFGAEVLAIYRRLLAARGIEADG